MVLFKGGHLEVQIAPVIQRQLVGHAVDLDVLDALFHNEIFQTVGHIFSVFCELFVCVITDGTAGQIDGGAGFAMGLFAVFSEIVHFFLSPCGETAPHSGKAGGQLVEYLAHHLIELAVAHFAVKTGFGIVETHAAEAGHDLFLMHIDDTCHRETPSAEIRRIISAVTCCCGRWIRGRILASSS